MKAAKKHRIKITDTREPVKIKVDRPKAALKDLAKLQAQAKGYSVEEP